MTEMSRTQSMVEIIAMVTMLFVWLLYAFNMQSFNDTVTMMLVQLSVLVAINGDY